MTRERVPKDQKRSQIPQGKQDQDGSHFLSIDCVTILTLKVEYQNQMKMKLREQRQNYVARYRKLMEKIELDGKEILKRYLEIGKVMQAKANKEVHMRSKKMLEDKLKQKTLLVENIGNLRSEIQASDAKSKLVKRRRI